MGRDRNASAEALALHHTLVYAIPQAHGASSRPCHFLQEPLLTAHHPHRARQFPVLLWLHHMSGPCCPRITLRLVVQWLPFLLRGQGLCLSCLCMSDLRKGGVSEDLLFDPDLVFLNRRTLWLQAP